MIDTGIKIAANNAIAAAARAAATPAAGALEAQDTIAVGQRAEVPTEVSQACDRAIALLEANVPAEAAAVLSQVVKNDPSARGPALFGTALFRLQRYGEAVKQFQVAQQRDPDNKEINDLLARAIGNDVSNVAYDQSLNPLQHDPVFGLPNPGPGFDTTPVPVPQPSGVEGHVRSVICKAARVGAHAVALGVGGLSGAVIGAGCRWFGAQEKGEIWTTWSHKNYVRAMLMLGRMRADLDAHNIHDTYPDKTLTAFMPTGLKAPEWTKFARTADGSWNNPLNPREGAAWTRFGRNVAIEATQPDMANLMTPNPRRLSRILMTRENGQMKEVPFLNMLAGAWIQFMVHDWVSHGDNNNGEFYEIPLEKDDPIRQKYHMTSMFVPKTTADPTRRADEAGRPPAYLNEVTHWWDGSQIYGSDLKTQHHLRSHQDGKMRVGPDGGLPLDKHGVEETGLRRNWWMGLSMFHTLFVKEHNSICDMLKAKHPDWSDERLFQTSRLINAAIMAKIHTIEWTPAILPNGFLFNGMRDNWWGAAERWLRKPEDRRVIDWFKPVNEVTGGLVGGKTDKHNVPYSLTEEFDAVYRLHSLLPDFLRLNKIGQDANPIEVPLGQTRNAGAHSAGGNLSLADKFHSFGIQNPGQLVLGNYPKTLQELSVPGFAVLDLAAIDILRDRERGIPRYNEFRRRIGLHPIQKFEDLTDDPKYIEKLKTEYGGDVEKIDLLVGTLSEAHRPEYFGFGETMFMIFILNASRRLQADRFFTDSYNAETYTQEGLDLIDHTTFKSLMLKHMPELEKTGLANVRNGFEPHDEGPLDLSRHPLERYSP